MANATSRLQIQIDAKNNASSGIKNVTSDLQGLDKAASTISGGLGALAGAAGIAGIAALGTAAVGAAVDMAKSAAEAERLGTAFDNMATSAGESSDEMLAAMQAASQGTVSNTELIASANRAMMLGVADSAEEMAQLMEIAGARGKAMGLSTAQAFSDLVTGLGRQSAMILDNLGITVDAEKANEAYANSIGTTAEKLTDAEKKQALLNAVIQDSTDILAANEGAANDAASNFERMDASIQNAKVALGELFSPAIAAIAASLAEAVSQVTEHLDDVGAGNSLEELRVAAEMSEQAMAAANREILSLQQRQEELAAANQIGSDTWLRINNLLEEAQGKYKAAEGATLAYNRAALEASASVDAMSTSVVSAENYIQGLTNAALNLSPSLQAAQASALAAARGIQEAGLMASLAQEQFAALRAEQEQTSNAIAQAAASAGAYIAGKAGGDAGLAKQKAVTEELASQRRIWREMGYDEKQINEVLLPGMVSQMNEADHAAYKVASGTAKISDEAKAAERAFSALESQVASVLQGALDVGVGVDPNDVLEAMGFPREDVINENARRLADIAKNGLMGQDWLDEFQNEVPDIWKMIRLAQNPQEEAARLLKDFQDGLLTSPIDKGMAKEIIKRQIMGDQNMAALANEIATELAAEMGIPMQQALAATQGTLGTGSGAGSQAASTFSEAAVAGLEEENGGSAFVSKFTDQMRASYSLLQTAGRDAGKMWGTEFLSVVGDNVPPGLIDLLTQLVTPGVLAKFAQQGTLQGSTP